MPPPQGYPNPVEGPADYTMTRLVHNDSYPAIDPAKADLTGKTVFVSGASRGIGKYMAISYAKAGASHIVIGARSSLAATVDAVKRAAEHAGKATPEVLAVQLDVADPKSVEAAAREVQGKFGKLDVLINNAGIMAGRGLVAETEPEGWWQCRKCKVARYTEAKERVQITDFEILQSASTCEAHTYSSARFCRC